MKTIIQGACFICSILGLIGTAGALDHNTISIAQSIMQFAICLALLIVAVVIDKEEYEE